MLPVVGRKTMIRSNPGEERVNPGFLVLVNCPSRRGAKGKSHLGQELRWAGPEAETMEGRCVLICFSGS